MSGRVAAVVVDGPWAGQIVTLQRDMPLVVPVEHRSVYRGYDVIDVQAPEPTTVTYRVHRMGLAGLVLAILSTADHPDVHEALRAMILAGDVRSAIVDDLRSGS